MRPLSKETLTGILEVANTETQRETVEACIKAGSATQAAKNLGINIRNVQRTLQRVRTAAASKGYIPEIGVTHSVPNDVGNLKLKGASVYHRATDDSEAYWAKYDSTKETEERDTIVEAAKDSLKGYKPLAKVKAPKKCDKDVLVVYPMGDPHIGMFSWGKETGEDFDLNIAERSLREAMTYLVDKAPSSDTAIILNLGDFFHSDNQRNQTEASGNALDVDGRWSKVLQVGITLMIDCVHLALAKHKKVIVKNTIGNHDNHTSQVLSVCMMHAFSNNPRVEIAEPQKPFFFYQFGKCMIGSTHGHMVKPKKVHGIVTNYQPRMWGETEHRYFYFGHYHHQEVMEENGLTIEIFNTLAAPDAWHFASGYKAKRNMKAIVLHKDFGEIERYCFAINRTDGK